jgi:hypothetical protein
MASIHLHADRLEIRLTAAEKALSLRRDNVEIPRSSIRSATLTDDPWIWVRGVRGKGAAIPLTLAVGQWKSHGGTDFLVIKKGSRPAVVLDVVDAEYSRVIVSTNHGAELVAALRLAEDEVRAKKVRATRVRTVSPRPIAVRAKAEAAKVEAAKAKADANAAKSSGRSSVAKKAASKGTDETPAVTPAKAAKRSTSTSAENTPASGAGTPSPEGATVTKKAAARGAATKAKAPAAASTGAEKKTTRSTTKKTAAEAPEITTPAKARTRKTPPAPPAEPTDPTATDATTPADEQPAADTTGEDAPAKE